MPFGGKFFVSRFSHVVVSLWILFPKFWFSIFVLLQNEYIKGYLAAKLEQHELAEKLNQQESAGQSTTTDIELATTSSDRQVGMKCKREEEDEEDVAWEETFNVSGQFWVYYYSFISYMKQVNNTLVT